MCFPSTFMACANELTKSISTRKPKKCKKHKTVIRSLEHNHTQSSLDNSAKGHMFDVPSLHVSDDFSSSLSLKLHPSSVISHSKFPSYFTFHSFISLSLSLIVFFSSPVSLSVASLTSWRDLSVATVSRDN